MRTMKHLMLATAAAAALALAGCGGGGSSPPQAATETQPTPYEVAKTAIASADTAEKAEAARDAAVQAGISAAELLQLNDAVDQRKMMLADAAAAEARQALVDAAMCEDATAACVAAHNALVAALKADVDALAEDEGATNAQQTAAQMKLDEAQEALDAVEMALADFDRTTETGMKVGEAVDAANGLEEDRSGEAVTAAKAAIAAAKMAIGEDDDSHDERIEMAEMAVARAEERNAVDMAIMDARTAIEGLAADADGGAVAAVQAQLTAAKMAVDENEHLTEAEEDGHTETIALLQVTVTQAQARVDADAEKMRMAEAEEERKRNEAMAATAAKLYAAISPASGDNTTLNPEARHATIGPVSGEDSTPFIGINYGGPLETAGEPNGATLNLDKDTMVPDHHGWKGKRYVEEVDGNVITEAIVYSDEMPTMGNKFGVAGGGDGFQYTLVDGALTIDGTDATYTNVGGSGFDQSAGVKEFALPTPNPNGATMVTVPGTFHGVAGTYTCTPTADNTCAARRDMEGFTLGLSLDADNVFTASATVWTFTPSDANARVMDTADDEYAVYGWWLRTPATGAWTASAFADYYGTPDPISDLDGLSGSATYTGGAAGKYALSSSTGGTNDAGHFTAQATLEADFDTEMISGTVDQFMSDGEAKDWSVALQKSGFNAAGQILGAAGANDSTPMKTVWTMGDDAAAASGHWKGNFREVGANSVPTVVTGDFYSEFGNSGKMVGAFGAKTE